ncbi:MAG: type III pantothenate kinase, partial [Balneolales bacterium]|nr:type III pantothenate kinase [Balneolales bacterium]
CLGAYSMAGSAVLVIDAGSACTIDFMNENGVFEGGVIMPGVQTLLKVFHKSAPGLPDFDFEIPESFPGKSSKESLEWGLSQLFLDGLKANLERFEREKEGFELFITGGDAELLAEHAGIASTVRNDLVFIGMEIFLEG